MSSRLVCARLLLRGQTPGLAGRELRENCLGHRRNRRRSAGSRIATPIGARADPQRRFGGVLSRIGRSGAGLGRARGVAGADRLRWRGSRSGPSGGAGRCGCSLSWNISGGKHHGRAGRSPPPMRLATLALTVCLCTRAGADPSRRDELWSPRYAATLLAESASDQAVAECPGDQCQRRDRWTRPACIPFIAALRREMQVIRAG
jgi:hypothetical protein